MIDRALLVVEDTVCCNGGGDGGVLVKGCEAEAIMRSTGSRIGEKKKDQTIKSRRLWESNPRPHG